MKDVPIKSVSDLRNFAIETMQGLKNGTIDLGQAIAVEKLVNSVLHSCRVEMEYSKITKEPAVIPFLDDGKGKLIEGTTSKRLGRD